MPNPEARNDLVFADRLGGAETGVLVYDPKTDTGHVLDSTAALVLAACDGTRDLAELAEHVEARSEDFSDKVSVDVALQHLADAGLLAAPLSTSSKLSRRKMIRTMAIGAAGIAALSLIESISNARQADAQPAFAVDPQSVSTTLGVPVAITLTAQYFSSPTDLVFWPVSQPSNGTVTISGNVATYTPNAGFIGTDTFPYTGGECVIAVGGYGYYPPPSGICPIGKFLYGGVTPALVTIVVAAAPETTTTSTTTTTAAGLPAAPTFTG